MATQLPVGAQEEMPLLRTKLYIPPLRREQVPRPRLIERLDAGLGRKLTLVSAPAGFGKTTLVSEWVDHLHSGAATESRVANRIAWLSLDESDNDPARFLTYFIAALQTLALRCPPSMSRGEVEGIEARQEPAAQQEPVDQQEPVGLIGQGALSALQSPQPPPAEAILTALINEIAAIPDRIVLVLDDYHLIEARPVHDALTFLLRHLPPHTGPGGQCQGMHLVIATREDPPLPLARLRARGQLTELRGADLRFSSSEAAEFLNQVMGLDLSAEDIAALETRTEGWIAGLQLAAISMQRRDDATTFIQSFTGSHRLVLDYLIEEVLEQQPESVQTFLLQTSILNQLTGSLCDALTGQDNGQATLEMLDYSNLFIIPLDDERRWYRYHHLFADLLRNRLDQEHAKMLPTLYHRAADWFEKNGHYVEAIDHFLSAGEFQHAADIIKLDRNIIFHQHRATETLNHTSMLRWLETLPGELMHNDPRLSIIYTQSAWELGRRTRATLEPRFRNAQQAYERLVAAGEITSNDPEFLMLPFDIYSGRSKSAIYTGNLRLSVELAEKALALDLSDNPPALVDAYVGLHLACRESGQLDKAKEACEQMISVSQPKGYHYGILEGLLGLGFMFQIQGYLKRSAQAYQQVLQYAEEQSLQWMRQVPITYIRWSNVSYYLNDLAQSELYILKALELCEQYGHTLILNYGKIYLAQLRLAQSEDMAALETIQEVERAARRNQISAYNIEIDARKIWIQARLGNQRAAAAWLKTIDLRIDERLGFWQGIQGIHAAHVMVELDQIEEALDLLARLEAAAKTSGSLPNLIEALVIQAVVWQKKGETSKAEKALEEALVLAAPERYVQVFLNEGKPMARLLYEAVTRGVASDYARQLLAAFPVAEPEQTGPPKTQAPKSGLIEPLSERELEVLQLLAEGLTNPEIASRLFLSLNTVKVHTRNIYGKLGVNNRTQASARARALGILSST